MALVYFPSGLGEPLGDIVATCKSLYINNEVYYVDSQTGDNAYSGVDRLRPWATVAYAVTQTTEGDIILCLSGHTETVTSAIDIDGITIVGAGQSDGKPTVKLQNNQSAGSMFTADEGDEPAQLLNLWLQEEAQANSSPKIATESLYLRIRGCYIECGQYDDAAAIDVTDAGEPTTYVFVQDTTVISVATATDALPYAAFSTTGSFTVMRWDAVTIDSGTYGWGAATDNTAVVALAGSVFYAESIAMGNGVDASLGASMEGYINVSSSVGGTRIDWTGK